MLFGRPSALVLAGICSLFLLSAVTSSLAADTSPLAPTAPPMTGVLRATEGGADSASGVLEDLSRTKRLSWAPGPAFAGVSVDQVAATFRIEGTPAARLASVAVFEKLAAADPNLQRPPAVVLAAQGAEYRGVVESLAYECTSQRCEVKVSILAGAGAATVKCPEDEWEWGPRR
jgi:hypothetical protein